MESGLSNSDVALLSQDGWGGNNGFFWIFALLLLAGGNFGWGGNGGNFVTNAEMTAGFNNQNTQNQLQQIALSSANNNYETARLISAQSTEMLQQNNTNLINAIQGFNQVNQNINNQTNVLSSQLQAISAQLNQCCCDIKTQMLQDRLADTQAELVAAQGAISNANQSQYLLNQLGRFVAWTPSGSQSATAAG